MEKQTLDKVAAVLLFLWIVLLLPWLPFAAMSGMAFDAGPKFAVYIFVGSTWTYPVSVGIAWRFRQKTPTIAFLPFINIVVWFISGCAI